MTLSLKAVSKIALLASGISLLAIGCVSGGDSSYGYDHTIDGEYAPTNTVPPIVSIDPTVPTGPAPYVFADKLENPSNLIAVGDSLYWVEFFNNRVYLKWQSANGGRDVVATELGGLPFSSAADGAGVFFADASQQTIVFAPHQGTAAPVFTANTDPLGIALTADYVYWTTAAGCLFRGAKEGGSPTSLGCADSPATNLAISESAAYMSTADGALFRYPLAHGGVLVKVLSGENFGDSLVADVSGVYWADSTGRQIKKYRDASGVVSILADNQFSPQSVAQDRFYLYFSTQGDGAIKRVPKMGGRIAVMTTQQASPGQIAVTPEYVYWINQGSGTVMKQLRNFDY